MCLKNNQPVNEYHSPYGSCPEYLNTCMPVIMNGYIFGEYDCFYSEWCTCEECDERGMLNYEVTKL